MKTSIIVVLAFFCLNTFAESTATLFRLERTNYKPEKVLHYDIIFDENKCLFSRSNPFDLYYVERSTQERLSEFSTSSKQYFNPRLAHSALGLSELEINFKALDEVKSATSSDQRVIAKLEKNGNRCLAYAQITDGGQFSILEAIEMKMKLKFGLPVGLEWLRTYEKEDGSSIQKCLTENCD